MSSSLLELRRRDLDKLILTKSISYTSYSSAYDLSYGSETLTGTTVTVYANVTVVNISHEWVSEGILQAGDMLGTVRYSYDEETDGTSISFQFVPPHCRAISQSVEIQRTNRGMEFHCAFANLRILEIGPRLGDLSPVSIR